MLIVRGRFLRNMAAGAIIGVAAGMMMPQMNNRTRRRINKTGRRMANMAGDFINDIRDNRFM